MPLSRFAQFVKDNYHAVADQHPDHPASENMKLLAIAYYSESGAAKAAPKKPRQKTGARSCTKSFSAKCESKGKTCKVNAKRRSCVAAKKSPVAAVLQFRRRRSPARLHF